MNIRILIASLFTLSIAIGGGLYFLLPLFRVQEDSSKNMFVEISPISQSRSNIPTSNSVRSEPKNETLGTMEIKTNGGVMAVKDFTQSPDVALNSDGDTFYIVYPPGTEYSDGQVQYEIDYVPDQKHISVSIFKEPIGEIRRRAAEDLKSRLGISDKEICTLNVVVAVPMWVSNFYANKNLGFPNCPGAVTFSGD